MKLHRFRKKLLSAAIAASVTFPIGMANADTIVKGGDYNPASRFTFTVSANSGELYTMVIHTTEKGSLIVKGYTLENKQSNGQGVVLYDTANSNGYSLVIEDGTVYSGEIISDGTISGVVLNDGDATTVSTMNLGDSNLNGKIQVGEHAYLLKDMMAGKVTVDSKGGLLGLTAITTQDNGGMTDDAEFIVKGTISGKSTGSEKVAVDFTSVQDDSVVNTGPGLKLTVNSGYVEGKIKGSQDDSDSITATGDAVFDGAISGVEIIGFNGNAKKGSVEFTGDILNPTHSLTVSGQGDVYFSKSDQQTIEGDLNFDGDSIVRIKVGSTNGGNPVLQIDGGMNIGTHEVDFIPVPDKDAFEDGTEQTYILVKTTGSLVDGDGTLTVIDSPLSDNEKGTGNNGEVVVIVDPKTSDQIKEDVKKAGGGSNAANAAGALADVLQGDDSDNARKLYERLANTDGSEFNDVVEESNVNNAGATQTANTNLASKSKSQITRRLDNLRSNNLADGNSYGDGMDGQSFWVQAMGSDVKMDQRTNDEGSNFSGYDAEMSGLTMGWDKELGNGVRGGVAFTLANVEIDKHNSNDSSNIRNYQMSFYGSWDLGSWYLDGILNLGQSKHNRSRYIDDFLDTAITAEFDSSIYGLQFMAGTDLQWGDVNVQPLVGFNYTMVKTDAYTEEANGVVGKLAQDPDGQKYQKIELGLGVEFSKSIMMDKGELTPSLRLMAWYDFKGQQVETTTRFVAGGDSFILKGADAVKKSYQATAAMSYKRNDNMSFSVGYEMNKKSDFKAHSMFMKMKYDF